MLTSIELSLYSIWLHVNTCEIGFYHVFGRLNDYSRPTKPMKLFQSCVFIRLKAMINQGIPHFSFPLIFSERQDIIVLDILIRLGLSCRCPLDLTVARMRNRSHNV